MRLGLRVGPVWGSTGGSRRRKGGPSTAKVVVGLAVVIALLDMIASGGWWVVLGYTLIGLVVLRLIVRAVKTTPGAQHTGGQRTVAADPDPEPEPQSERMYHSDRR